ncbi:MAG: hypothetical protein IKX43_08255, partial [Paludibacteraceae bacterium]|nr:hypothetical protein [Paludibacteraceae bacterium]
YDGENRLTRVLANYQGDESWHELARYEYYRHGPLARTVLGTNLQGVDYAYTLQGWTKGVNLSQESDTVKADVYGYELQYNNEDYKPIGIANHPQVDDGAANLYNGNIAAMRTTLTQNVPANEGNLFGAQTRRFVYDELNRLKASQVIGGDQYATSYVYDANGNITSLSRNDQSGAAMDNLTYRYATDSKGNILNNRLLHVNDAVVNNATTTDIRNQGNYEQQRPSTHNYAYDEIGNLIKDKSEEIAEIRWTVTGKVSDVIRANGSSKPDLHFDYDAMGQRIAKTVTNKNVTTGDKLVTTYYVRNPQGNVMAVYEKKEDAAGAGQFQLKERHLYGINRLGMVSQNVTLAQFDNSNVTNGTDPTTPQAGDTHYELTNHLGNVMAVISDEASDTNEPTVVSLSDYYPFGMTEPGRSWNAGAEGYRYGFNTQENVPELGNGHTTALYWEYDGRLGRRWNLDPDPTAGISLYAAFGDNPILFCDLLGNTFDIKTDGKKVDANSRSDIESLVKEKNREYLSFDDNTGRVSINITDKEKENKILSEDMGLKHIKERCDSEKKYYYASESESPYAGDLKKRIKPKAEKKLRAEFKKENKSYDNSTFFPPINVNPRAEDLILNASTSPYTYLDQTLRDYMMDLSPIESYDGSVQIDNRYDFINANNGRKVKRSSVVFHELVENFYRTEYGTPRGDNTNGAHAKANREAGKGRQFTPMDFNVIVKEKK